MHDADPRERQLIRVDPNFVSVLPVREARDLEYQQVNALVCIFLLIFRQLLVLLLPGKLPLQVALDVLLVSFCDLAVDPGFDCRGILDSD